MTFAPNCGGLLASVCIQSSFRTSCLLVVMSAPWHEHKTHRASNRLSVSQTLNKSLYFRRYRYKLSCFLGGERTNCYHHCLCRKLSSQMCTDSTLIRCLNCCHTTNCQIAGRNCHHRTKRSCRTGNRPQLKEVITRASCRRSERKLS